MKYLLFTLTACLISHLSLAQQTPARNQVVDTVRAEIYKQGKVKMVNGTPMNSGRDAIYNFAQSPDYSIFINAVRKAGLTETFKSRGPITLFIPTNSAFVAVPAERMDTLLKQNHLLELVNLLTYHAVSGSLKAKDIAKLIKDNNGQATLTTIGGGKLIARIDTNRNIVLVDETGAQSIISTFDIPQSNGMAHVVTRVLVPKYKVI